MNVRTKLDVLKNLTKLGWADILVTKTGRNVVDGEMKK